jgi:hypothetical protein
MYRSRFKYFGQTGYTIFIGLLVISFIVGLLINFSGMEKKERLFMLYGGPFLLFTSVFILNKILTEINEVEITGTTIRTRNLVTKKQKEIEKKNIKGFKDTFRGGYRILLIDKEDKVVLKISEHYYKDFKVLIDNLGLTYLERERTFWDKIIKTGE